MTQATLNLPIGKATLSVPYDEAARILIEQLTQKAVLPKPAKALPSDWRVLARPGRRLRRLVSG
jgi:hypothetical protein